MEENKKESRTQSLKEQSDLETQERSPFEQQQLTGDPVDMEQLGSLNLSSWLVSDEREVLSSEWALSAHWEDRWERGGLEVPEES